MERFIHEMNIAHFRKRLAEATDPAERETLRRLLAEEEAKERHGAVRRTIPPTLPRSRRPP